MLRKLKRLLSSHIGIGRNNAKYNSPFVLAVSGDHFLSNSLNILWLVADWYPCYSWQVNQGQVDYISIKDLKDYGTVDDATVVSTDLICETFYSLFDLFEIIVLFIVVIELSIRLRILLV